MILQEEIVVNYDFALQNPFRRLPRLAARRADGGKRASAFRNRKGPAPLANIVE